MKCIVIDSHARGEVCNVVGCEVKADSAILNGHDSIANVLSGTVEYSSGCVDAFGGHHMFLSSSGFDHASLPLGMKSACGLGDVVVLVDVRLVWLYLADGNYCDDGWVCNASGGSSVDRGYDLLIGRPCDGRRCIDVCDPGLYIARGTAIVGPSVPL